MTDSRNTKLYLFYVYNILKEYSDEQHPMKQEDIATKILNKYGIECERKSISANIKLLRDELGYDIQTKSAREGVYLGQREYEESEALFLIDALFSSREISGKQAAKLAEKIYSDFSIHQRKKFNYIHKADEISRNDNKQFFWTVEELGRAIKARKKISFDYISYDDSGKKKKPMTVSPYFLVNSNGKYYLVCCVHRPRGLWNLRVEYIENIKVLDGENGNPNELAAPIREVKDCERGFDIAKYANEKIYMFHGETITAEILLTKPKYLTYVYDWFGKSVRTRKTDDGLVAILKVNEQALIYWLLQYGEAAKLIYPQTTVEKVKKEVERLSDLYK